MYSSYLLHNLYFYVMRAHAVQKSTLFCFGARENDCDARRMQSITRKRILEIFQSNSQLNAADSDCLAGRPGFQRYTLDTRDIRAVELNRQVILNQCTDNSLVKTFSYLVPSNWIPLFQFQQSAVATMKRVTAV